MSNEKGVGNKVTIPIAAMMVVGIALGFIGLIQKDYASAKGHDVWLGVSIGGFVMFTAGVVWLTVIQPRNRK